MSLRESRRRAVFSNFPMLAWNLMLKRLASISLIFSFRLSPANSRRAWAFALAIFIHLANLRSDGQLLRGHGQGFNGQFPIHTAHFEEDASGQDDRDPTFNVTLTGTHTGFRRLLRERLVRKYPDPNLTAAFNLTSHGNARSFELTVGDPGRFQSLDAEFAEGQSGAARGDAFHLSALHLAELHFLGAKH